MKKVLVALVVLSMVCLSSMAFAAADVSVGGSVQVRSRDFNALTFDKTNAAGSQQDTQERIELDVNVKAGDDVKGKIALWNDFNDWGRFEQSQGNNFGSTTSTSTAQGTNNVGTNNGQFGFREAWVNFNVPGIPVNVTAGHQLLALGQGWFFRSKHFGSDAWVVANVTGPNTAAFVDVKINEGNAGLAHDDADAYVLLDVYKIDENNIVGIDITDLNAREALTPTHQELQNISLNYTGKIAIVGLKAQADVQMGKIDANDAAATPESKFKGDEIVVQGNIPVDPVTINFTVAYGSGKKWNDTDNKQYVNFLDIDPHYTFLYEYKTITACGAKNTGFCNTTALSVGATADVAKSLNVGLNLWYLQASEKAGTPLAVATAGAQTSSDIGSEIDATVNWKLYDNLTWNWNLGYFKPGDAMKTSANAPTDAVTGIQGILSLNF